MVGRGRPPYGRSSHSGTESSNPDPSRAESKVALRERKRKAARQDNPEWLDGYSKTAWEPNTQDLQNIAGSIGTAEAKWKQSYKPIRDKVFAHHDIGVSVNELFGRTLVGDIEGHLA